MKAKLLNKTDGRRVFLVVCDKGDDPIAGLTDFARQERLTGSSFTAIGAVRSVTLGYFDPDAKEYVRHRVDEQCEVLSLVGDVAVSDGEPSVHAHIVLGKRDASAVGGHLFGADVWPTLELVLTESPEYLQKRVDDETGLALVGAEE